MKTGEPWSVRSSRSTSTHRTERGACLHVSRVQGAIKRRVALPWQWSACKGDQFRGPAYAERRGQCATEAEAQQAADVAASQVLSAFAALEGEP